MDSVFDREGTGLLSLLLLLTVVLGVEAEFRDHAPRFRGLPDRADMQA
jgi:hypothetical protein